MAEPYDNDLEQMPRALQLVASTLLSFARALDSRNSFSADRTPRRWSLRPRNFAQFAFQPRAESLMVSCRGMLCEFDMTPELPLTLGRARAYVVFRVTSPRQMLAACRYLTRSFDLAAQGRRRFRRVRR
jgi:hypothetical protein